MTSDLDIYRSAKILIDQHGLNAIQIAGSKALEMHTSGDVEGEEVWCRIMDAIQELQRTERGSNERQH